MTERTEIETRHWEELSQVALQLSEYWDRYDSQLSTNSGFIIDDNEFEALDAYLVNCLLSHLKAEFTEFVQVEDWRELLNLNKVNPELTRKFHFVGHRRTFQGTCSLCQGYKVAIPRVKTKEVIDAYLVENSAGWSPSTTDNYLGLLNRFAKANEMLPTEPGQVQDFLNNWTEQTRLNYFKVLKWFYAFAHSKFGVSNVMASMKSPKIKRQEPDFLDFSELQQLFNTQHSKRDYAALLIMFSSALRVGEAAHLHFSNIKDSYLIVPSEGKTGTRHVPLMPEAKEALLALKDGHGDDDYIFWAERPHAPLKVSGFQWLVKSAFVKAGLPVAKAHPHTLRHSYTGASLRQGSNSAICQQVLGHSHIQTTELYTHLGEDMVIEQGLKFNPLTDIFGAKLGLSNEKFSLSNEKPNLSS